MPTYLVRAGSLAELYLADAVEPIEVGLRVFIRTARGAEIAEVVRECQSQSPLNRQAGDARVNILRKTTEDDETLFRRLERKKFDGIEACRSRLSELGSTSTLLDIDQLFDGTIVLHYLGTVDEIAESAREELVETYEAATNTRDLVKLLDTGCGPTCGTDSAGCSMGGCASCSVNCH